MVNNRAPHTHISLNTPLQAVAVRVTLHRVITFCSIYIPPGSNLQLIDLDNLVQQLPTPFILMGAFNGHNILLGSQTINDKGKKIESFLLKPISLFLTISLQHIYTQQLGLTPVLI